MAGTAKSQSSASESTSALMEATVLLRPLKNRTAPDPHVTREIAKSVLDAAQQRTGITPASTNVLDQLHSFSVSAPKVFLDALAEAPSVDRVIVSDASQSAFMAPINRRSVELPD